MSSNDFLGCCQFYFDDLHPFEEINNFRMDLLPRLNHDDKYVHGYLIISCRFELE